VVSTGPNLHLISCVILGLMALGTGPVALADDGTGHTDTATDTTMTGNWVDRKHHLISERSDELAEWVDNFFSGDKQVEDSATSIVRVRPQFEWDEQDDSDWKLRATGRFYLPRSNERLSLVFFGEEGDFEDDFAAPDDQEGSSVGLEYRIHEKHRSQAYLIAGLKAGPKGKVGGRYRYQVPFGGRNRFRFSEELFWVGGDGFGTLTRANVDHRLTHSSLLRFANKVEYSEDSNGAEWNSNLAWITRIDEKSAFRAFTFIRGETDPEVLKSRGFGVGYRRQFLREWLYWEIEPRYGWRKRRPEIERDGVAQVKLRLEILFGSF